MKQRKHRVIVKITFDDKITGKEAARRVNRLITEGRAVTAYPLGDGVTKFKCKEFSRVMAADKVKHLDDMIVAYDTIRDISISVVKFYESINRRSGAKEREDNRQALEPESPTSIGGGYHQGGSERPNRVSGGQVNDRRVPRPQAGVAAED